jgi:hypothetical protein
MTGWGKLVLASTLGAALLGACGDDEAMRAPTDASAAAGGTAGTGANGGASGVSGGGAGADGGDASDLDATDGTEGDAATEGCVDIHVPAAVGFVGDRDHIWRDATGVHMAWITHNGDASYQLDVSSFDAATGASLGERLFPEMTLASATGRAPDGTVGVIGNASDGDGGGGPSLMLLRTDDPSYEKVYQLPPWPGAGTDLVGVGWDGEAFAVHGFADDGTVYVTRIAEDGTVLLQPQAFGIATGYAFESRFSTDAASGVTYGLMGGKTLVAHHRDGTPVPDPPQVVPTPVQSSPGGQWTTMSGSCTGAGCALVALSSGVATAFSGDSPDGQNTLIQTLDQTLAADADTIFVPGELVPNPLDAKIYDWNRELAIQPSAGGWWLAGNPSSIDEYVVQAGQLASRRTAVSYSDEAASHAASALNFRHFESVKWNDEIWLGFQDTSNQDANAEQPFRIIRVKPGCTYQSMTDIEHGW